MNFEAEVSETVNYLKSDRGLKMVDADAYWPKWDGPYWRMLLLHEMGESAQIPDLMIERYLSSIQRLQLKIFPIYPEDSPPGTDPYRGSTCHCHLGNLYQILHAKRVDVDAELPWIRPWFLRYQMKDGGLTCDNEAYLVKDECPSSMVGTIQAFEAILLATDREWTPDEKSFLDRAARFLIGRQLRLGSSTKWNASERKSAEEWVKLCFPRFYFYDVLRGLNALTIWSEKTGAQLPRESFESVFNLLSSKFPGAEIVIERSAVAGMTTLRQTDGGEWMRKQRAGTFPLLEAVSRVGDVSPFLSQQWSQVQSRLAKSNATFPAF